MRLNTDLEIANLISKFLKGSIEEEEKQQLYAWRKEQEANEELWRHLTDAEYMDEKLGQWDNQPASDKLWNQIAKKTTHHIHTRKSYPSIFTSKFALVAALLVIGLLISTWFHFHYQSYQILDKPIAIKSIENLSKESEEDNAVKLIMSNGTSLSLKENEQRIIIDDNGLQIAQLDRSLSYKDNHSLEQHAEAFNTLIVPRGKHYQLMLADGTKVWLNAASSIKYPTNFQGKERRVELQGEAYFEVAKDSKHPFIVNTGKSAIKVLGTSFNIKAYPDEQSDKTSLISGSVKISSRKSNKEIELKPGDEATVTLHAIEAGQGDLDAALAWRNKMFIFHNSTLDDLMQMLSREYNVDVVFARNEIKEYHFTGRIERYEKIEPILDIIGQTAKVRFKLQQNKVTVFPQ